MPAGQSCEQIHARPVQSLEEVIHPEKGPVPNRTFVAEVRRLGKLPVNGNAHNAWGDDPGQLAKARCQKSCVEDGLSVAVRQRADLCSLLG